MKYMVEADGRACSHCGKGEYWNIARPDGVLLGISYSDKEEADDIADMLNDAVEFVIGSEDDQ